MDECVSGLHVVLVNDWCICQPCSCGATISQPAEERSDGWKREGETERGKNGALDAGKKSEIEDFFSHINREVHLEGIEGETEGKLPRQFVSFFLLEQERQSGSTHDYTQLLS